jgi:peptidoglycan/xylan/chitin deacetylase (PgdA/CDA1 family)
MKGTFFIEGWNALHHPELIREIAGRGHEIGLHGWTHEPFATLDRRTTEQLVSDGRAALRNIGVETTLFRAPGGVRGPYLQAVLEQLGFDGDSSVNHSFEEEPLLDIDTDPYLLSPRLGNVPWRWNMIDFIHYRRLATGPDAPDLLERRWISALDHAEASGTFFTPIVHAFISGVEDARLAVLERVLMNARSRHALRLETVGTAVRRLLRGDAGAGSTPSLYETRRPH